jgi:DNA-binding winged helix-turn-helix (wHTH) protein/Tol biopolymer transport system component
MKKQNTASTLNFSIGEFSVIASRNLIIHDDQESVITPKMLSVLTELATHQGKTLSKEHLLLAVWGTIHTSDMVLSRAISDLRKVFGDSAKQQNYIETVVKQGYRLKREVCWQQPSELKQSTPTPQLATSTKGEQTLKKTNARLVSIVALFVMLLLVSVLFFYISNTSEISPRLYEPPKVTNVTENDAIERSVRFDRSGKYLAYVANDLNESKPRIILHSLLDKSVKTIGIDEEDDDDFLDLSPVFSPNGQQLAFKRITKSGCSIYIISLENNVKTKLTGCPYSKTHALDWSPDGIHLITNVFNYIEKKEGVILINTKTSQSHLIPTSQEKASGYLFPRFSPDGKNVAVVYYQPNENLWTIGLIDVETGGFSPILPFGNIIDQVVWNKTGNALFYLMNNHVDAGIWRVDLASKEAKLVQKTVSVSLDFNDLNNQFAYTEKEEKINIWQTIQLANGAITTKPIFKELDNTHYPSLSSNNRLLAFISKSSSKDSFWVRRLSDNSNTLLYQGSEGEKLSEPTWSPDNNLLLVSVSSKNSSRILQFDLELGNSIEFPSENNVKMAKWSKDGSRMYWYEQRGDTWHVIEKDLASGEQKKILSLPVARFEIPDKHNLHYQKIGTIKVHSRRLVTDGLATPKDKMLLSLESAYTWDAHENAIYYPSRSADTKEQMLFKKDLVTGRSTPLYPIESLLASDSGRNLSVSQDGRTAFYSKLDKYETDIVILNRVSERQ